jgi:tetratricopeptide (TPR) repeat protein
VWLEKLPLLAMCGAAAARALIAQSEQQAMYPLAEHGVVVRFAQACYGLSFYVWKTLWPSDLGPLYQIPGNDILLGRMLWASAAAVAILAVVALSTRRRAPAVTAALAVYALQVAPVLGFVQSGPQLVADRYSYLSCLGFAVLGGAALRRLLRHAAWRVEPRRRALLAMAMAVLIATLQQSTFRQADVWVTSLTLWARGVRVSPESSIAHANFADALANSGDPRAAAYHYRRSLALNPNDAVTTSHLAHVLAIVGEVAEATILYERTLRMDPDRGADYPKLARALLTQRRAGEAVAWLHDRIERAPDDLDSLALLADLLATHPDEMIRDGEEAVRLASRLSEAHGGVNGPALLTWATALAEAGRFEESIATAQRALTVAERAEDERLSGELRRRLSLFREGRAYHFGK